MEGVGLLGSPEAKRILLTYLAILFVFLFLAVLCVWGTVTAIVNIGDTEAPPETPVVVGFLEVTRGFAIVLFAVFGLVAFGVGWFLAGDTFKGWFARARSRS